MNDVPLKSLTFQTCQTKLDGGSNHITKKNSNLQSHIYIYIYIYIKLKDYWIRIWNYNPILHMSKFMWELHHNYPIKYMPCVYLIFLIFVSSELMSAKY